MKKLIITILVIALILFGTTLSLNGVANANAQKEHLEKLGLDFTYEEGPGNHGWPYWDDKIQRVLEWLPKDKLYGLPMWAGDRIFLDLLDRGAPFFSLKLSYIGDALVAVALNGLPIEPPFFDEK